MKLLSHLSILRGIGFLLILTLCVNCRKDSHSTIQSKPSALTPIGENLAEAGLSNQTRTATYLNNLNNFQQVYGDQNYPQANAQHVAADDNIYTASSKLNAVRDSTSSFTSNSVSSLALQGFGFSIPGDATIENITVRVRRFKIGRPSIGDAVLSVMRRYNCDAGEPCRYGVYWTYRDTYSGKIYPDTETEYSFSQSGSGNNGGMNHNQAYQWTPAMVNHQYFGVRIDNFPPIGKGTVRIFYDLVEVTVAYSQPI